MQSSYPVVDGVDEAGGSWRSGDPSSKEGGVGFMEAVILKILHLRARPLIVSQG